MRRLNDRLYVMGGMDNIGEAMDDVIFASIGADHSLGQWQTSTSLPEPRSGARVALLNDHIYLLGGVKDNIAKDQVWYAQPDAGNGGISAWYTTTASLPPMSVQDPGYYGHAAATNGDYLYVTGGTNRIDGNGVYSFKTHYAKPTASGDIILFSEAADMTRNLVAHESLGLNGQLYLVGGATNNVSTPSDYVGAALLGADGDLISGWVEDSFIVPARYWLATVVSLDSWIYVIGGSEGYFNPISEGKINRGSVTGQGDHNYVGEGNFVSGEIEIDDTWNRAITAISWNATISDTTDMGLTLRYRTRPVGGYLVRLVDPLPLQLDPRHGHHHGARHHLHHGATAPVRGHLYHHRSPPPPS